MYLLCCFVSIPENCAVSVALFLKESSTLHSAAIDRCNRRGLCDQLGWAVPLLGLEWPGALAAPPRRWAWPRTAMGACRVISRPAGRPVQLQAGVMARPTPPNRTGSLAAPHRA